MATAQSLLLQQQTLQRKNQSLYHSRLYLSPQFPAHVSFAHIKIRRQSFRKLSLKCFLPNSSSSNNDCSAAAGKRFNKNGFGKMETKQNPVEIVAESIMNVVKLLQKPAAAAVVVGLLWMYDPKSVLAVSGGCMGGSSFSSSSSSSSDSSSDSDSSASVSYSTSNPTEGLFMFIAFSMIVGLFQSLGSGSSEETSVLKLQVGLSGLGRSLQKDLNRIAETADTSTLEGLHYVLKETIQALLQHHDYCISAYSSVDVNRSRKEGEKRFNRLSIEERGKFDKETLVNINNVKKQSPTIPRDDGSRNEYLVITILVAAGGEFMLPSIDNRKDLAEALQKLSSIPSCRTLAVQVLWTPQKEDDTLSEQEMLEDYSSLRPFQETEGN